jgi:hypothetical protein
VNSKTITYMAKECIRGQIIENMKANGDKIKCMVRERLYGQMDVNI